ncbi:MAG TPA: PilT/PilU family type 4a pilus ATPase, partial [Egibacteraceae bacterium]|nr:PilT/PilU family type 4a pilus ATPase [Egibacteraceae bacterium]
ATAVQSERGTPLGRALVELGMATEQQIVAAIARQIGVPFADTSPGAVDPDAAALLPKDLATQLLALPVAFGAGNDLVVALADPGNSAALERVAAITGMRPTPALAVRGDLLAAIEHLTDDGAPPGAADGGGPPGPEPAEESGAGLLEFEQEQALDVNAVLLDLVRLGGSDLHITAGLPPTVRVHGDLQPLEGYPILEPADIRKIVYGMLTQRQRETFENELELDLSYSIPDAARFRVNVFQQRNAMGAVMRTIPFEIKSVEQLGVPTQVTNFSYLPRGFVLVTGPTGSGKSTTLAALIDIVNRERAAHIMTVEDPIEFLHAHKRSVVNQRELGTDTHTFAAALKHVLRQDPDVILVGEMRDLETIQVALTAAETGHLVFGTLHTQDAPQTVDRVIDVFPPHQQEQIRVMLAGALQGVVCQQLLKTPDGKGRVAACEVMIATPAIRNLIREGKTHQMYSMMQAGKAHGMVTMDQSLAALVLTGKVRYEDALERCSNVADFNRLAGRT